MSLIEKIKSRNIDTIRELGQHACLLAYIEDNPDLINICNRRVHHGDQSAIEILGIVYFNGDRVASNKPLAFEYLSKLDEPASTSAVLLGLCYLHGYGTAVNYKKAKSLIHLNIAFCEPHLIDQCVDLCVYVKEPIFSAGEKLTFYSLLEAEGIEGAKDKRIELEKILPPHIIDSSQNDANELFVYRKNNPTYLRKQTHK